MRATFVWGILLSSALVYRPATIAAADTPASDALPQREKIHFQASWDGTSQAAYVAAPSPAANATAESKDVLRPLVVSLHSWSGNLEQRQPELERLVAERQWFCLQPDFRGANDDPLACASEAAQQDILDAVDWMLANHPIDTERIYLTGSSGGGHMTMMMAARYPKRWTAASAWVGISDLAAWHKLHAEGRYGQMMRQCCGGAPGDSPEVDEQYRLRSPLTFLQHAVGIPLDIAAGIHDGHSGSVPVRHSLIAFNKIAAAVQGEQVSESEMQQLAVDDGRLQTPRAGDEGQDPSFQRAYYLRRNAGVARVTIFEGGHEGIATAAMAWFDAHLTRSAE
ncbi:MAG: prolyl oligopeptidase family serine peptidase [Planctomycetales bacterium]|nr:prolyl oligopeptidase family serine peptidase [Planctomycetales bacterium]